WAGGAPEAVRLEGVRERIDADGALRRAGEQLARHGEQLVVRRRVGLARGLAAVRRRRDGQRWRGCRPFPPPAPAAAPPAAPARLPDLRRFLRRLDARTRERAVGEPVEADPQAGRHVAHRVERLVVGDDLEQVTRPRRRQPDAGGDRDAQVAPVAHAGRRRAVHEVRAALGEEARGVVVHHPPVADCAEVRRARHAIDVEMGEHARGVVGAARVLDVEEDRAPHGRARALGLGRRDARRERRLRVGGRDQLRRGEVMRSGLDDLVTFNHWLCLTRLRAAGAVMLFTLGLAWLRVGNISTPYAFAVCAGLFAVSGIGLSWPSLARAPRLFFYLQSLADLAAITVGIGISVHGLEALLFRSVYALVIVPASLISVPSGLVMAAAATIGHEMLLVHERGLVPGTLYGVESLMPPFLFFLLAQQCFFYGAHLKCKNTALSSLAYRLVVSTQLSVSW